MIIFVKKFGTVLTSRQSGKEAFAAFQPTLQQLNDSERIDVDFEGVEVLSPSWADEFLTPLQEQYGNHVVLRPSTNLSVQATLELLAAIHK